MAVCVGGTGVEVAEGGKEVNVGVSVIIVDDAVGIFDGAGAGAQEARNRNRKKKVEARYLESASLLATYEKKSEYLNAILGFMNDVFKIYPHNPPHYFVPNAMYMVTGAILHNQDLLNENIKKGFVLKTMMERAQLLGWNLEAWAILNNHYHFIAQAPENAGTLSKLIRQIHSITAIQLNEWDKTSGRQVWFNYWDSCLTYEKSYLARLHYVHVNPVKHGLTEHAINYPYCSYRWFVEQGDDELKKQVFNQPIDQLNIFDDF